MVPSLLMEQKRDLSCLYKVNEASWRTARRNNLFNFKFGGLVGTKDTAMLNDPLPEIVKKVVVDEKGVHWSKNLVLPYQPFIGTIGTSPEIEAITSLQPDYYGGNMDVPDVAVGNIIYLPVNKDGAYLYLGIVMLHMMENSVGLQLNIQL